MHQNTDLWRKRFEALARAQSWYLYVLLVVGAFYLALDSQIHAALQEPPRSVILPTVGIPVDPTVVWATAPLVLGLLSLAALGTFPALRFAYKKMECGEDDEAWEARDTVPTAIDLIVYSRNCRLASALGLLAYPAVLTLFVVEASWLWWRVLGSRGNVGYSSVLLLLGALATLLAWVRLFSLWAYKCPRAWRKWGNWHRTRAPSDEGADRDLGEEG